ncbi:restriction endonuclease subunit S [Paracoccus sp. N5]|uniref:restriction endonuclease subunit S n=1 Tax=Paracoccus sp. N5 TaxID=1101189 RepID=UPI0009D97DD3|nr:restriction endonuclease subunit S [Paracoccus sp. N5]
MSGAMVPQLRFPGFAEGWPIEPLGPRTTKVGSGVTPKGGAASYLSEGIPLIRSQNVRDGRLELDDVAYIAEATHARMSGTHVMPDDILLNITGASIGRSCIVPDHVGPANVNQHVCIIRLDAKDSPAFIQQYLASPRGQKQIDDLQGGSGREGLNFENIRSFRIPFPLLAEQQKIADFLGTVDAKLDALRRKKSGLEAFKSGLMQRLFSQELRFTRDNGTEFPEWNQVSFAEIAERSSDKLDPRNVHEGMPVIDLENIESGTGRIIHAGQSDESASLKSVFRTGEVLFGKLRPYLRKFAQPDFEGCCSSEIWVLRGKRVSNDFLFHLIQSSRFMELATISSGSKMPRADWSIISSAEFDVPHPDEQRKIADALSAMDAKIAAVANQITHMETFKKGLLQQMFV